MHPMLNTAVRAARKAGDIITRYMDRAPSLTVTAKAHNDFVTEVDRAAENTIIDILRLAYPDHAFLAEESGSRGSGEYQWIIDPLDGTTNFLHGFPQIGVSIALSHRGRLFQAVIYDPLKQDLFTASRGAGAQLNGRRIRVANRLVLDQALIGTGFPVKHREHLDRYCLQFRAVLERTAGLRRAGAASLDLAYVACGRLDGFWELGLSPWDIAAGALLIEEAGGTVSDLAGGPDFLDSGEVVAGNLKVHKALLAALGVPAPA
ncbi:MAG: inositol monophosphatase family protein [Gammaproteobacteria bacterium]